MARQKGLILAGISTNLSNRYVYNFFPIIQIVALEIKILPKMAE
jgi:hypothetical protein